MKPTLIFSLLSLLSILTTLSAQETVTIGTQVWMTKNLDVSTFRNGDLIPEAKTMKEWEYAGDNRQPIWCFYNFDSSMGVYGKLYNWYALNDPRGIAPIGYHIPSVEEWSTLIDYFGGRYEAGNVLKMRPLEETYWEEVGGFYEENWKSCSNCSVASQEYKKICPVCKGMGGSRVKGKFIPKTKESRKRRIGGFWDGNNQSGFYGAPGGRLYDLDGGLNKCKADFQEFNKNGYYWSSSGYANNYANYTCLESGKNEVSSLMRAEEKYCFSIRCIKDRVKPSEVAPDIDNTIKIDETQTPDRSNNIPAYLECEAWIQHNYFTKNFPGQENNKAEEFENWLFEFIPQGSTYPKYVRFATDYLSKYNRFCSPSTDEYRQQSRLHESPFIREMALYESREKLLFDWWVELSKK